MPTILLAEQTTSVSPVWFHVTAWTASVCGLNSVVSAGPDPLAAVSSRFQSLTDPAHDASATGGGFDKVEARRF